MSLQDFLQEDRCDLAGLSAWLDQLPPQSRIDAAVSISAKMQQQLWEATADAPRLALADFVPDGVPPLTEVIHWGRNSLPLFSRFQKRFCRAQPEVADNLLWGYNEQKLRVVTGPGYFVARETTADELDDAGVVIDYTLEPEGKVPDWPRYIPNNKRLSRWIYNGTRDYMRRVSAHVTIGRASRAGEWLPNWFVLCRAG